MCDYLPTEESYEDACTRLANESQVASTSCLYPSIHNTDVTTYIKLNVGGTSYRLRTETLRYRCETSLLAQMATASHEHRLRLCDGYIAENDEYYFERPGKLFEMVFDFYTTGYLHKSPDVCVQRMLLELQYWRLPKDFIAPCCRQNLPVTVAAKTSGRDSEDLARLKNGAHSTNNGFAMYGNLKLGHADEYSQVCVGDIRRRLWRVTDEPSSSAMAKLFAICSITFVVISVGGLILGSLPALQTYNPVSSANETSQIVKLSELVCVSWFTFEYLLRFLIVANRLVFIKEALNVIDLLTVIPFYLELLLEVTGYGITSNNLIKFQGIVMVMKILRVFRVARVFRLARYSSGLQSFGTTVRNSMQELSMLLLFLVTAIIFFSTIMYFIEKDEPDTYFDSIPAACWWCVVTMTTVGYGDAIPVTFGGKIVASITSISGVLVLAFPITMIVENFTRTYEDTSATGTGEMRAMRRRRGVGRFA